MNKHIVALGLAAVLFQPQLLPAQSQVPPRMPILFDTDLGSDLGDGFALALVLASPELDLRGVTTVGSTPDVRALMACRFLTMTGRRQVAVAAGALPQPTSTISPMGHYRYYYHPDVLFNRTTRPQKEAALEFLHNRLKSQPGKITIVAAGPLTNIARLVSEKPECKPWIRQIVIAAGPEVNRADGQAAADNIQADSKAAQVVFRSGIPLVFLPTKATAGLSLNADGLQRVFEPGTALSLQIQTLDQLSEQGHPLLADALAVALCTDEQFYERFGNFQQQCLQVDDAGAVSEAAGAPNARVARSVHAEAFLKWYVERLAGCVSPASRPVKLVVPGAMPQRVHVAEDYEYDMERFWWMSGKAETKNLPPGSSRACRGTLTHDFDDLLGYSKQMYTAVIFNPVPGPPMGKNTRLSFRYWLQGTDSMRVQIYSLTNGYHRNLALSGLPQGRWESGTVDLTLARRPDGTGGPLSEHERIDDIQFYTDHRSELIIDDVVLYEAAAAEEQRPFPRHIHFAAPFDTGQQGKHWPGEFELVPEKGAFWRAVKSVPQAETNAPWLKLGLRGERTLGGAAEVSFRCRLTGATSLRVALANSATKARHAVEVPKLASDAWQRVTVDFGAIKKGERVDEVQIYLPRGAEALVDDLLVYERGN